MKRISSLFAIAAISVLTFSSIGMSATKTERTSKSFTLDGRVLRVDQEARTLLVRDQWSNKIYLINVPRGVTLEITFGLNMKHALADIWLVNPNDRVRVRCKRSDAEHLARLKDGTRAIVAIVAR